MNLRHSETDDKRTWLWRHENRTYVG